MLKPCLETSWTIYDITSELERQLSNTAQYWINWTWHFKSTGKDGSDWRAPMVTEKRPKPTQPCRAYEILVWHKHMEPKYLILSEHNENTKRWCHKKLGKLAYKSFCPVVLEINQEEILKWQRGLWHTSLQKGWNYSKCFPIAKEEYLGMTVVKIIINKHKPLVYIYEAANSVFE